MVSEDIKDKARVEERSLMRLQEWILTEYKNVSALIQTDVRGSQYLRVARTSPHPVLVTQPSLSMLCRVAMANTGALHYVCLVQSFNMVSIKEVTASFDQDKVRNEDYISHFTDFPLSHSRWKSLKVF